MLSCGQAEARIRSARGSYTVTQIKMKKLSEQKYFLILLPNDTKIRDKDLINIHPSLNLDSI